MRQKTFSPRYIAVIAMFTALAFVAVWISKIIPNVQGFLSYEPKDAIIVIAGFVFGPLASLLISVLCSLIEMVTISTTGPYGLLMNVVSTCAFSIPAAWIYLKKRSRTGALIGLAVGVLSMAACMVVWNYVITPFYMGVPRETVAAMLLPVFLPFNLVKGGINAGLTLLLYKPIVGALRRMRLVPPSETGHKGKFSLGFTLLAVAVLVTFVLLLLVLLGVF